MIKLELTPELYHNLRALVLAGAKSPHTDHTAIMAAAHLLQVMDQAETRPATNGHDAVVIAHIEAPAEAHG